ncbi:MAG: diphthamide biosynthesis enzyme Dph2 [Methanomassiliicoccaceae archaeon]|nr:diphthamide biosynthesis enzyme Dph2 [Methanomassiliicoccaceae archaeon]
MFDLCLDKAAEWILSKGFTSVAIQVPEGLRMTASDIADQLSSRTNVNVTITGDPCYGACDVPVNYKDIAEGLIHFGHSPIPSVTNDDDILFIEAFAAADIRSGISKIADRLPERIGLLASVQYVNMLKDAKDVLEGLRKIVFIGKGDARMRYDGQILGCNCSAAESVKDDADCFLYIGEGDFHPLAAALCTDKEVMAFDPVTNELRSMNDVRDRIIRKRFAAIESAKNAFTFLVIVSSKAGQRRDAAADGIIKKITSAGKKAYKVVMNEITPDSLLSYKVDVYVNTACPRLATDDSLRYGRPILTIPEAEIAIGVREWDDNEFDQIRG